MNNKVSYLQELVFFVSIYCGDWVHTAVMMRLPNSLDVRGGGEFPSAYDFCPGKLKVGEPRESKATKISKKPTGNPKKYFECNYPRVWLKCDSSLKGCNHCKVGAQD